MQPPICLAVLLSVGVLSITTVCSSDANPPLVAPSPSPGAGSEASPTPRTGSLTPAPSAAPTSTPNAPRNEPRGFPLDPEVPTDAVIGERGVRAILSGGGPTVRQHSLAQASADADVANGAGWDCRVHAEYEGSPAVDWYVPVGTPVYATMDGEALLIVNTVVNGFDYHGVDREPYLGNPDRSRAPLNPFPGPGGGLGSFVSIFGADGSYRADYGHLELTRTLQAVPEGAFAEGYSRDPAWTARFTVPQETTTGAQVARWPVRRGDVIGYTGDAGYSEAPHLHYQITGPDGRKLCPTTEEGFGENGWLFGAN